MKTWFTADQHMGHQAICEYCNRPFANLQKMEQTIIQRYRSVVKPEDTVYFVGDLTIKGSQHRGHLEWIVDNLPGTKILILGNHDKFDPFTYVDVGFQSVHTSLMIDVEGDKYILHHDPVASIIRKDMIWLTGHVHSHWKQIKNCINVGVDMWEFYPVSSEEIHRLAITYRGYNETN